MVAFNAGISLFLPLLAAAFPAEWLDARASTDHNVTAFNVTNFVPPGTFQPHNIGIKDTLLNATAQPWLRLNEPPKTQAKTLAACTPLTADNPSTWWYENITHNGQASFMDSSFKANYQVFRNVVTQFGADNTGSKDASGAIQNAINAGASNGPQRTTNSMGTTGQPAVVYLPAGTYMMQKSLQLYVGTLLVGDPINPPVLKANAGFPNDHIVYGKDPNQAGTVNFYIGLKNVIIDSTAVDPAQSIGLLDWTVSQATQLANVVFNMPNFSTGHVGVTSQYDFNSNIILNDLTINGGAIGLKLSGQQWILKNIKTSGTTTGIFAGGFNVVCLSCSFAFAGTGIDATGISGSLVVIDSSATSVGTMINGARNSIILENISNNGPTVQFGGNTVLSGSVSDTWVYGHYYASGNSSPQSLTGFGLSTPRPSSLLSNGKYFTMAPPTYQQYSVNQVINIKTVGGLPVLGDGATDDTVNINAILSQFAGCKVIYFPAGTYIVTDTINVPKGSIIYGDAFGSAISAVGSNFFNPSAPTTMFNVGNPGDVGVAQISDMIFTVADVLQGCKLVQVNIAGSNPGDVGFFNSHFRIGGAAGSKVETNCGGSPDQCRAAWGLLHLTSSSSAYIENMWGWSADHDLDGGSGQTIATGRGMLVEATQGTWLVGTAMEHHTLYQYNYHGARNVFSAFQQSETPYWQGPGNDPAPAPWSGFLINSDPTFSNCNGQPATCSMAWFEVISNSSDLFLYNGMVWSFFNNKGNCNGDCQQNAVDISSSSSLYIYGQNVKAVTNIFVEGSQPIASESANQGGWGGVVAAYLFNT